MKLYTTVLAVIASISMLQGQSKIVTMKTIEVTGEAQKFVDPDEIIFSITIEEYWKEEFEGKKHEDYKTKIDISVIEQSLIKELNALNISMDDITLKQAGNYWRQRGKDFLVNKTMDISLKDFAKANEIANTVKTRGVRNMNVAELKHKDIDRITLEVKADAVKAAREKADLMAAALDKKIKDVITIVEIDQNMNAIPRPQQMAYSRVASMEAGGQNVDYENYRKLEINASVRVVFEME